MELVPRPLTFPAGHLNGLSERLLASHHAKNYSGAVKRLNAIRSQLAGGTTGAAAPATPAPSPTTTAAAVGQ